MYKNVYKDEDENNKIRQYFLILYQGLKTQHFYWEFVNSLRKIFILCAFILPDSYKILFSASTLVITWRIQNSIKPYKREYNNEIEIFGVNVGIITLSCGMVFNQNSTHSILNTFLLIIMLIFNAMFLTQWFYLLIANLGEKYTVFAKAAKICKCVLLKQNQENIESYLITVKSNFKSPVHKPKRVLKIKKKKRRRYNKKMISVQKNQKDNHIDIDTNRELLKNSHRDLQTKRVKDHQNQDSILNKYSVLEEARRSEISSRIIDQLENKGESIDDKMEGVLNILKSNKNKSSNSSSKQEEDKREFNGYDIFHPTDNTNKKNSSHLDVFKRKNKSSTKAFIRNIEKETTMFYLSRDHNSSVSSVDYPFLKAHELQKKSQKEFLGSVPEEKAKKCKRKENIE